MKLQSRKIKKPAGCTLKILFLILLVSGIMGVMITHRIIRNNRYLLLNVEYKADLRFIDKLLEGYLNAYQRAEINDFYQLLPTLPLDRNGYIYLADFHIIISLDNGSTFTQISDPEVLYSNWNSRISMDETVVLIGTDHYYSFKLDEGDSRHNPEYLIPEETIRERISYPYFKVHLIVLALLSCIIMAIYTVYILIYDRLSAQADLLSTKTRLIALINALPAFLFVIDRNGNFLEGYAHDAIIEESGISGIFDGFSDIKDVIGKNINGFFSEDQGENILLAIRHTIGEGKVSSIQYTIDGKKGKRWFNAMISPYIEPVDGKAILVAHDITMLHHATEAAEEATRVKSEFLASMSHEIRTPINAIMGMNHLALQTDLTEKQALYLNNIDRASKNLMGIINDVLDFSKIEAGLMKLETIPFDCRKLISHLIELNTPKCVEKEINLICRIPDTLPENLIGDPLRLGQVLLNLVSNAIKFTKKGQIEIDVEELNRENLAIQLRFSVKDTGIGISDKNLKKLFSPFTQAESSTTRRFGGTGLGLSICREIVTLMEGKIEVTSQPGRGSTFYFTVRFPFKLPAKDEQLSLMTAIEPASHSEDSFGKKYKILVVEDNPVNQLYAREILEKTGLNVTLCSNGQEALDMVLPGQFDLILMDIQMPFMDGYEVTRILRKKGILIPIIAMTANVMSGDREKALDAGMNDYLGKPVKPADMMRLLNLWLKTELKIPSRKVKDEDSHMPEIMGVDILRGMKFFRGDVPLYRSQLLLFADQYRESPDMIERYKKQEDRDGLLRLLHKLKGAAGTLSILNIQTRAENLEDELRSSFILSESLIGDFIAHLRGTVREIEDKLLREKQTDQDV